MSFELVLITGMSGSGKSVALRALEDAGYYCVDNLPPELLLSFVALEEHIADRRVAIAMDVRSATTLPLVPIYLREQAHVIDTSVIRSAQLQAQVKALLSAPSSQLTLVFESFAFKRGIPVDADYVFDVRMLPNPHYEPELKALTGRDQPVIDYLVARPEVDRMLAHIQGFLDEWLPPLARDHRSYVTVALGCTGGQHRSVYLVEKLAAAFAGRWITLKRHRELESR